MCGGGGDRVIPYTTLHVVTGGVGGGSSDAVRNVTYIVTGGAV